MQQFYALGSKTSDISLKNPERIREEENAVGIKNRQKHEKVGRVQRGELRSGRKEGKSFEDEGGQKGCIGRGG